VARQHHRGKGVDTWVGVAMKMATTSGPISPLGLFAMFLLTPPRGIRGIHTVTKKATGICTLTGREQEIQMFIAQKTRPDTPKRTGNASFLFLFLPFYITNYQKTNLTNNPTHSFPT
jgi:hypothetical protein